MLTWTQDKLKQRVCSRICKEKDPQYLKNKKETCLKKYGVENPSQNELIKEKKKQTCLKHFGVTSPLKSKQILKKVQLTNLKKYGNICSVQNNKIQQKIFKNLSQKFNKNIKCVGDLNTIYEIKEKTKQTLLKHYGVKNQFQRPEIKQKLLFNNFKKIVNKFKDYIIPQFTEDEYIGWNNEYTWKCVKCR